MQRTKVVCTSCGREISKSNFNRHQLAHLNNPKAFLDKSNYALTHEGLTCQFCGKECKNRNSLCNHERLCKLNPNHQLSSFVALNEKIRRGEVKQWNAGLTKDTDERVAKNAESLSSALQQKVSAGWKPYFASDEFWTADMRAQKSAEKIQLFKEHPELHPNRKLASNKSMSYPEQITANWLSDHNISYECQYRTVFNDKNRYVDFYLADYKLYIEVDGEYWHAKSTEIDAAKDLFALQKQGINTLRIKPKLGIEKQLSQFFAE